MAKFCTTTKILVTTTKGRKSPERDHTLMKNYLMVVALLALTMVGCADKLSAAKTAVVFGKAATGVAAVGFTTADKAKLAECTEALCKKTNPVTSPAYKQCLAASPPTTDATWVACYAPMAVIQAEWMRIHPLIDQGWKTVDAILVAAAQVKDKQQLDYFTPLKATICLLTKTAVWLPDSFKKKVAWLVALMAGFSCN